MATSPHIKDKSYEPVQVTEDFGALIEEETRNENREGTVVEGTVVLVDKKRGVAMVDVGLKSEGVISLSEFKLDEDNEIEVGYKTKVFIESFESRKGITILSKERAVKDAAWKKLQQLYADGENVEGIILGKVRGGFAVQLFGLMAFLPGSQIDVRPISDLSVIMDIPQPFRILKMDDKQGNLVVSRKAIMEESLKEEKDDMIKKISEGMVVRCTVKNIAEYGVFFSIHNIDDPEKRSALDGLLHKSDISWEGVDHPSTVFKVGQELDLKIIQYNPENKRISLGLKQLQKNPWEAIKQEYIVGQKYKGKISAIVDYGVFVTLAPNIDGLVYHTEMHWTAKNVHPRKLVELDEEVEVVVLEVDIDKHRISLSIKRCSENPWEALQKLYSHGSTMKVVIKNLCEFGMFVVRTEEKDEEYPINILIPAAEISWEKRGDEAMKNYSKEQEIECMVTLIDPPYERVVGSIRRLYEDTTETTTKKLIAAGASTGIIKSVKRDGMEVDLDGLQVYIEKSALSRGKPLQDFNVGDEITFQVLSFERDRKEYKGSVIALEQAKKAKIIEEFADSKTTSLGDMVSSALDKKE